MLRAFTLALLLLTGSLLAPPAIAQEAPSEPIAGIGRESLMRLFVQANPMLWPLAICSVVTVALALERFLALRRGRVMPKDFVDRFLERLQARKLDRDRAAELCRAHDCPAARVFALAIRYWGEPIATIRQGMAIDAQGELLELRKNTRALGAVATLAPLLGLLGTVVGLIESFEALGGKAGTARGEALAQGISLALVATAIGLGIAIVAVTLHHHFLARIDRLAKELDDKTRQVIDLIADEPARPLPERRPWNEPARADGPATA
jgi:biopolymer transport protein ExbB